MAKASKDLTPSSFGMNFFGEADVQKMFDVEDFIDTGSYELNRILSGKVIGGGIPEKRVTGFIGETSVGKSYFTLTLARSAQKKGYKVAIFDTENALTKSFCDNLGVDIEELLYKQVLTIEDFRRSAIKLIEWKSAEFGRDKKLLIILDSLGGLMAQKFVSDIEDGKDTSDQGIGAKITKAAFKMIGNLLSPHNVTFVYTNHITVDNSGYVPVTVQTGGKAAEYYPSNIVFLKKKIVRDDEKVATGINIAAQCTKTRFCPPYQSTDIYLDWKSGLDRYSGLVNLMVGLGIIKASGGWYTIDGDEKKYRESNIEEMLKNDDSLLEKIEDKLKTTGYNTISPLE